MEKRITYSKDLAKVVYVFTAVSADPIVITVLCVAVFPSKEYVLIPVS